MIKTIVAKFTLFTLLSLLSFHAISEDTSVHQIHEERINRMIELGIISPESAKKQIKQIEVNKQRHKEFTTQTRGVSSTIKNFKIYKIENEAIEIPSN